ncbi:MAG: S49 family peptidase [Bacteroidota bacterium]
MLSFKSFVGNFIARKLMISREGFGQFLAEYAVVDDIENIPLYADRVQNNLKRFSANINLTVNYDDTELPEGSIAFHLIKGPIMYGDDPWGFFFSSKRFRENIIKAENNPQIGGHFFLSNSGGGDAYYLDVAAQAVADIEKPKRGVIERMSGSAAWYLLMNAGNLSAQTPNEIIGSIGTMVSGLDLIPYFEKLGAKYIEEYSHYSDRKNAKYNGLLKGDEKEKEQFIEDELDPLALQFREAVKKARPATANLAKDGDKEHPVFRGETYNSQTAIDLGLIDDIMLIEDVIRLIGKEAQEYIKKQNNVSNALKLIS